MREFIGDDNENQTQNIKINQLPIIEVKINNIQLNALIDTGSEISLLDEKVYNEQLNKINKCIRVSKIRLVNANGKKFAECNKILNTEFEIKNQSFKGDFVIVMNLNYDMILGEDMLSYIRARIDLGDKLLLVEGQEVPIFNMNYLKGKCAKVKNEFNGDETKVNNELNGEAAKCVNVDYGKHTVGTATYVMNTNYMKPEEVVISCPVEKDKIMQILLQKYSSLVNFEPRVAKGYIHKLEVDENKPFKCKTYPIPYKYKDKVQAELNNMLNANIIESARTNYINPIVVVKKKDDSIRLCLDARNLNQITKSQFDAPQTIDSLLSKIGKNTIFSKLDLKNSFWLIPLHYDSYKFTGFSIDGHIFQFKVVPFGLQSASSALVRAMQNILDKFDTFCVHYIDDILIYSETEAKHVEHLDTVLNALNEAGLKLNLEKCEFFRTYVRYLGYKIKQEGISIGEERVKEIKDYPRPTNLKTLRGLLGILNYYKKFIPNLSELELPLIELLRKNFKWEWDERRENAFQTIKKTFHDNLLLYSPDFSIPFTLRTDASDNSVAAELTQMQGGVETPICFISRVLRPYETRYSVSEKEMVAIIYSLSKLFYYLIGNHFIIETDHSALCYLMKNRFANNRIYRWSLLIQEYSFTIKHRPGRLNITADALTRNRQTDKNNTNTFTVALNTLSHTNNLYSYNKVIHSQAQLQELKHKILTTSHTYRGFTIKNNFIIKTILNEEKFVIDESLAAEILLDLHNQYGHIGIRKTWLIFRENYYCKRDLSLAKDLLIKCHECCLGKTKNYKNQNVAQSIITNKPLELVAMDFVSNLIPSEDGYKHILIIIDVFSKFIKLYPTKRCNTITVKKKLYHFYRTIGKPERILTDNATYFNNDRLREFLRRRNISMLFTTIRHPQANPAERYIQEVIRFMRLMIQHNHREWLFSISDVENYMNNVPNTVTQISPVITMLGQLPDRPWTNTENLNLENVHKQVKTRIERNAKRHLDRENKKRKKKKTFVKGDMVVIKRLKVSDYKHNICAKLQNPYEGPYVVENVLTENTYELKDLVNNLSRGKFHIELMYSYEPEPKVE